MKQNISTSINERLYRFGRLIFEVLKFNAHHENRTCVFLMYFSKFGRHLVMEWRLFQYLSSGLSVGSRDWVLRI